MFEIYARGFCFMSVCTDLPLDQVAARANAEEPTGIRTPWVVHHKPFRTGEPNPAPCNQHQGRIHVLLSC